MIDMCAHYRRHNHTSSSVNYGDREEPYSFRFATFLNLMISHFQTCLFLNLRIFDLAHFQSINLRAPAKCEA